MKIIFSLVYWILTLFLVTLGVVSIQLCQLFGKRLPPRVIVSLWGKSQLFFAGCRVKVRGLENIPDQGGCLFVANHRSYFDIFLIHATCSRVPRWVLKESLLRYPILGFHLRRSLSVALEREKPVAAARVLLEVAKDLQQGDSFIVFPEGTRNPSDEFMSFKSGVFSLALKAGVPLVPVVIRHSADSLAPRSLLVNFGKTLEIDYLKGFNPKDYGKDRQRLAEEVRQVMQARAVESRTKEMDDG